MKPEIDIENSVIRPEPSRRCFADRVVSELLVFLVALLMLFTGLVHIGNSYFFLSSIMSYDLTSLALSKHLAVLLPTAHLVLGVLLICKVLRLGALLITATLFGLYLIAQVSVLVRGLELDCGCFGIDSEPVNIWSVVRVTCLLALTGGMIICEKRQHRTRIADDAGGSS